MALQPDSFPALAFLSGEVLAERQPLNRLITLFKEIRAIANYSDISLFNSIVCNDYQRIITSHGITQVVTVIWKFVLHSLSLLSHVL